MKPILTVLIFFSSLFIKAQNLIISGGLSKTNLSFSVLDARNKSTVDYDNFHFYPDLNVLFEIEIKTRLSIKSGFYLHNENYDFVIWMPDYVPLAGLQWTEVDEHRKIHNINIPLLFSFNFGNTSENLKFHIDLGPYLGLGGTDPDGLDLKNDFGGQLLLGFGTNKWQFTFYTLKGFNDRTKPTSPLHLQKTNTTQFGLNFTVCLSLEKKQTEK